MKEILYDPTVIMLCLGIILLVTAIASMSSPSYTFSKINTSIKKLEIKILEHGKTANLQIVKDQIDALFKQRKIDGLEREYLHNRIKILEDKCMTRNSSGPKYAAGGPEDRI